MSNSISPLACIAAEHAAGGLWTCDADGWITWYNQEAAAIWGRAPEVSPPNMRWSAAVRMFGPTGDEIQPADGITARTLGDGSARNDELVFVDRPDGTRRAVSTNSRCLRDENGLIVGVVSLIVDVTDRVQRHADERERIGRAERHFAAIVASSDDAIIGKDLNSIVTSWNKGAERIFGYAAEEMIGRSITELIPPDLLNEEPVIIARVSAGLRIEHYETVRQHKDGHLIPISLTISPIKTEDGRIVGASKIARDISARKRDEQALQEARAELERVNTDLEERIAERTASLSVAIGQLEEFSYTVSHDLRAPLRAMNVYSRALLEDFPAIVGSDPEAARYVERIADNASRLDRMILDVLTFSRVARQELRMEVIDLDRLVRELLVHYPNMATVEVATLDAVLGHTPSITQAMSNLLTNAVKFAVQGEEPRVKVWSTRAGDRVRVFVHDEGVGIDPKLQHRLFRMFERLDPNDEREGNGVGLAIVKKAVERMSGTVGVESDGVKGSTFWVDLPAAELAS